MPDPVSEVALATYTVAYLDIQPHLIYPGDPPRNIEPLNAHECAVPGREEKAQGSRAVDSPFQPWFTSCREPNHLSHKINTVSETHQLRNVAPCEAWIDLDEGGTFSGDAEFDVCGTPPQRKRLERLEHSLTDGLRH